jgi:hypothetical protein
MPAELVPQVAIPDLAAKVDSPALLWMLQYLQKAGFISRGRGIDEKEAQILQQLTDLGLVEPGSDGTTTDKPSLWIRNGNGARVLKYIETTPALREALEPRFTIADRASTALATLSEDDQLRTLLVVDALLAREGDSCPTEEVRRFSTDYLIFLVRITPELRAFLLVQNSGEGKLLDLVREDTLQRFLAQQGVGSKV